jgi:SET domain-containing protein
MSTFQCHQNITGIYFRLDATEEDNSLGRLVNDNHMNPSAVPKICEVDGMSHICFYACRDISIGEEITFNYNGTKNVDDFPWRRRV